MLDLFIFVSMPFAWIVRNTLGAFFVVFMCVGVTLVTGFVASGIYDQFVGLEDVGNIFESQC